MRANTLLICFCCFTLLLVGCGSRYVTGTGVKVKGRIVKGGQPIQVPGRESGTGWVEVNLFPADLSQSAQLADTSAQTEADGSFLIDYEGRGVPAGKYKLAVFQRDLGPGSDQLKGKFSQENTKITVDAEPTKVGGTLDLGTIDLDTVK